MRITANPDFRATLDPDGPLHFTITPGETYFVVAIGNEDYRVVDDGGEPILFPKSIFTVLDATIPPRWQFDEYAEGEYHLGPTCASMPGFYEDFFFSDGDVSATNAARRTFREMLEATLPDVSVDDQRLIRRDLARLPRELSLDASQGLRDHAGRGPDRPAHSGDPMPHVDIVVDVTSMRAPNGGHAIAGIRLTFGDRAFPAPGWNDFIVVVLTWWADALAGLVSRTAAEVTVHFMDGPYAVEVSRPAGDVLRFRALEGSGRTHESARGEAPCRSFALAIASAGRRVLTACEQQGWWSTDADALVTAVGSLEHALASDAPAS